MLVLHHHGLTAGHTPHRRKPHLAVCLTWRPHLETPQWEGEPGQERLVRIIQVRHKHRGHCIIDRHLSEFNKILDCLIESFTVARPNNWLVTHRLQSRPRNRTSHLSHVLGYPVECEAGLVSDDVEVLTNTLGRLLDFVLEFEICARGDGRRQN